MSGHVDGTLGRPRQASRRPRLTDRPHLVSQVALGLGLFGAYLLVDGLGAGRRAEALRHGRAILRVEHLLHLDPERALNTWLAPHRALATLANYEYASTYIISALALFVWVWLRRPEEWRFARDSFVVLNLLALATFLLFPTAPPRMLTHLGFIDTVSQGGTVGSWGSGIVDTANQLAAMPSLHVGWALWVSVVLARFTAGPRVQVVSALHVLLTVVVVMSTANHYLLDAVAVVLPILAGTRYARWRYDGPPGEPVPSCDAFFLHVEAVGAPQHVGGLVTLEAGEGPSLEQLRRLVAERLLPLPHFRRRLETRSRWRRPRWVEVPVDVAQHVSERTVRGPHGLERLVAELAESPLPRDRPLWTVVLVRSAGDGPTTSTVVVLVHHAVADGIGTIMSAMRLFDPLGSLPEPVAGGTGRLRRAAAVVQGLTQLATDGVARPVGAGSARRGYGLVNVAFQQVQDAARLRGVRVTDLLIALTVDAVRAASPALVARSDGSLKISVPLMMRAPGAGHEGNSTAAIIVDMPTEGTVEELVAAAARRTGRLRRPTRAVASRFVMANGLRLLPEPAAAWFARSVYGARFLHLVVSNLPGPGGELTMFGRRPDGVYPILPVAPGTALAIGALTWGGRLGFGLATDPALLDAATAARHLKGAIDGVGGRLTTSAEPGDGRVHGAGSGSVAARSLRPVERQEQPRP